MKAYFYPNPRELPDERDDEPTGVDIGYLYPGLLYPDLPKPHPQIGTGYCSICGHYGDDCTGYKPKLITKAALDRAFEAICTAPCPYDKPYPFKWITRDYELLLPSDMATPHLFYALRMMFNNVVPPAFRVGVVSGVKEGPHQFKRYADIPTWTTEYLYEAAYELTKELLTRDDLKSVDDQLGDLCVNAWFIYEVLGMFPTL
jgi:hypothetical protein